MENRFRFRVWDTIDKHFVVFPVVMHTGGYIEFPEGGWDSQGTDDNKDGRFVINQCTGLKDKNGKLIYEGNRMLQYDSPPVGSHYGNSTGNTGIVEYDELQANWWIRDDKQNTELIEEPLCKFRAGFYEVIGDIYKNKK